MPVHFQSGLFCSEATGQVWRSWLGGLNGVSQDIRVLLGHVEGRCCPQTSLCLSSLHRAQSRGKVSTAPWAREPPGPLYRTACSGEQGPWAGMPREGLSKSQSHIHSPDAHSQRITESLAVLLYTASEIKELDRPATTRVNAVHISWTREAQGKKGLISLKANKQTDLGLCCWKILRDGIADCHNCLLRNMYAGQEATVRTGHGTADQFKIGKGVWQGCNCHPACLIYTQSTSCEMPGWRKHRQ